MKNPIAKALFWAFCCLFWSSPILAQPAFQQEWAQIDSLEKKGLIRSALTETEQLWAKIKAQNPRPVDAYVKALIYYNKYQSQLETDGFEQTIIRLESELAQAQASPLQPILQTMLAQVYDKFLQAHQSRLLKRTAFDTLPKSLLQRDQYWFLQRIHGLYWASLSDPATAKIPISDFPELIGEQDSMTQRLNYSLYDLLLHRALRYFGEGRSYWNWSWMDNSRSDSELAFADAAVFVQTNYMPNDTASAFANTLRLFQTGLKRLIASQELDKMTDLDLRRLYFVHQLSNLPNRDQLYEQALLRLAERSAQSHVVTEVLHQVAQWYASKARNFNAQTQGEDRWWNKKALELCRQSIARFPNSYGALLCRDLETRLLESSYSLLLERIYPRKTPMLARLTHKNTDSLYLRLVFVSQKQFDSLAIFNYRNSYIDDLDKLAELKALPTVEAWAVATRNEGDAYSHTTEIAIPAQSRPGHYLLLISKYADFSYTTEGVGVSSFQVSDLAYFAKSRRDNMVYYTVHRRTGEPLKGVQLTISENYDRKNIRQLKSDENGRAELWGDMGSHNLARLIKGNDTLTLGDYMYQDNYWEKDETTVYLFSDRSIYRPGQTVYFKGIVVDKAETQKPILNTLYSTTIVFRDANYQEIAKVKVHTNAFGSFSGSFVAPTTGLMGQMSIVDEKADGSYSSGRLYFRVEEYKRPQFSAQFDPQPALLYGVGDTVELAGEAKAFSGVAISNAQVKYRVKRRLRLPYYPYYSPVWSWMRENGHLLNAEVELTQGTVQTDAQGRFNLRFCAEGDARIPADLLPQFYYSVYADVIDVSGETHSCEVHVSSSLSELSLSMEGSDQEEVGDTMLWDLSYLHRAQDTTARYATVQLQRLKMPDQIYAERYWPKPDYALMSEADFKQQFPQFAYAQEDEVSTWAAEDTIWTTSMRWQHNGNFAAPIRGCRPGWYRLTAQTIAPNGQRIDQQYEFYIYTMDGKNPTEQPLSLFVQREISGKSVQTQLASAASSAHILIESEQDRLVFSSQWRHIKDHGMGQQWLSDERHRGGYTLSWNMVYNNRFYGVSEEIYVPHPSLSISIETFRDKLAPGAPEEWRIQLRGDKKERVAAEMMATLYDASLDELSSHYWYFYPLFNDHHDAEAEYSANFSANLYQDIFLKKGRIYPTLPTKVYPQLHWFGLTLKNLEGEIIISQRVLSLDPGNITGGVTLGADDISALSTRNIRSIAATTAGVNQKDEGENITANGSRNSSDDTYVDGVRTVGMGGTGSFDDFGGDMSNDTPDEDFSQVAARRNLNELVFFFPQLHTDANGDIVLKFTMNEALTRWKFMALAHTKKLVIGSTERELVTQKDLMIVPNAPRFVHQGDTLFFAAKVTNLSDKTLNGQAILQIFDAATMRSVDTLFQLATTPTRFALDKGLSEGLTWRIIVPQDFTGTLTYRVLAKSGDFSDGEENSLPVLSNRLLMTETLPLSVKSRSERSVSLQRMNEVLRSPTAKLHQVVLEFTPNPAWYAVRSLPYLMEYEHECSEQLFSRFYANSLASSVIAAHPRIQTVFEQWKNQQPSALESNLVKNQELKSALLAETPWVLQSQSQAFQQQQIALLFDLNRMAKERETALRKLYERQDADGGFAWFPGGGTDAYITRHIVAGMGHLERLGVQDIRRDEQSKTVLTKALGYLDRATVEDFKWHCREASDSAHLGRDSAAFMAKNHLNASMAHSLYARSFFNAIPLDAKAKAAFDYYQQQAQRYWTKQPIYTQGLLALALHRLGDSTAQDIVRSLRERALQSEELGMYWPYTSGYFWYEMPIETHALMIEVFEEVGRDAASVEALKIWLLKNKQSNHWRSTKATAAACYALLMRGSDWLQETKPIELRLDDQVVDLSAVEKEAGTGYFKTPLPVSENALPQQLTIENPNAMPAWGGLYWQYFETIEKITAFQSSPLRLRKTLYKEVIEKGVKTYQPIQNQMLEPGDLVLVRIEITADRAMEYLHLKDGRAAGLEPIQALSRYSYQSGLGFYESHRDMATHFFISRLPAGSYILEYPLRVNLAGNFCSGITTLQSMYAPEFSAHTEGKRLGF